MKLLKDTKAEYGKSIIKELSKDLTKDYGKGYSQANLFNMVRLYDAINDFNILQTLSVKLTWSHLLKLITIESSGIHVAEYMTQLPPKEVLQGKLHAAIARAKEKFDDKQIE